MNWARVAADTRTRQGTAAPDCAAVWNGALVRYVNFMDNYLAPHQTCLSPDTFASVFAAAEYADPDSEDFLAALAVAYHMFAD